MIKAHAESLWLVALATKCKSLPPTNAVAFALVLFSSWLTLHLLFWAHPGGAAWGRLRWRSFRRAVPGPRGLPFFGSMGLMAGLAHRRLASAAESCGGKRLMAFSLGETRAVVTCHPEVAREILNGSAFVDRPAKESAYELMFGRSMGFAPYGVYWTTLRRIASAHLFCPKQLRASGRIRFEIANQMATVLDLGNGGEVIRVRDVLKLASLNNMMYTVFGRRYVLDPSNAETAELRDLVEEGYDLLGRLNWSDHFSFLADFDVQKIRFRCSQMKPRVNRIVGGIMAEQKGRRNGDDNNDADVNFVDVLMSLQGPDRLSESDMVSLLWEMIFRGTDTVAVLMEWILARLVLHRDVQSRVQHELDRVVGRSRAVAEADLAGLPYLNAVVQEVLRLHPPGPLLSWSRLSIRDVTVDGHLVPAGTTAMVNMWAIARDPANWPDPLGFKPERFLGTGPDRAADLRLAPFGSGRRVCPGKAMGMTAVSYWVARLLHEFEFAAAAGGGVDLSEEMRLSCEMKKPLTVTARRRIDYLAH